MHSFIDLEAWDSHWLLVGSEIEIEKGMVRKCTDHGKMPKSVMSCQSKLSRLKKHTKKLFLTLEIIY